MMMQWLLVVIVFGAVSCENTETLRTLREQVSALLEDFSLLAKNSEVTALRQELSALRYMEHIARLLKGPRELHVSLTLLKGRQYFKMTHKLQLRFVSGRKRKSRTVSTLGSRV
jgi:hypothetical protein